MSSLYRRATPRQAIVLRMIEGAVRNAAHAHPGRRIDDEHIARSIAKRATGTLTSQWGVVLAAPRVRPEDGSSRVHPGAVSGAGMNLRSGAVSGVYSRRNDRGGASHVLGRTPVRRLFGAIGKEAGNARRAGQTERYEALVDVLRLIGAELAALP